MKIVIDARMVHMSGVGRYLRSLLSILLPLESNEYVLLGDGNELSQYAYLGDFTVIQMKAKIYNPLEHFELLKKIPPCDVYFSPHFITPYFKIPALKRITTIHDLFHLSEIANFNFFKKVYLWLLYRSASVKSDKIITVSEFSKKELIRYFPVSEKKISVIYNYVDEEVFKMTEEESSSKRQYLLFVGNIKPHKNLLRLVNVFNSLKDKNLDLIIVGDKDGFINGIEGFDEIVKQNERILFTGKITDNELIHYYCHAEFLVFPSLYEGFGYPPLEAMFCNTAVLGSDIPVVREICGNAIMYFNPFVEQDMKEKIQILLDNKEKRQQLICDGKTRNSAWQ